MRGLVKEWKRLKAHKVLIRRRDVVGESIVTDYNSLILDRTRETIAVLGWEADPELLGPPSDETRVSVAAKCQHAPECTIRPMPKPEPPVA